MATPHRSPTAREIANGWAGWRQPRRRRPGLIRGALVLGLGIALGRWLHHLQALL
jgi:hypothetical protein